MPPQGTATQRAADTDSLSLSGARRVVVSHCPGCCAPHDEEPTTMGLWVNPNFTRKIVYYLCGRCTRRFEKAGKRARRRLAEQVEQHLEALGATLGLKREGLRA